MFAYSVTKRKSGFVWYRKFFIGADLGRLLFKTQGNRFDPPTLPQRVRKDGAPSVVQRQCGPPALTRFVEFLSLGQQKA
jgi:hypothetical protein